MAKTACNLVVMMGIVVAGSAATALSAFGAEPDLLAIRIFVVTVPDVRPDMLVRAQTETARIYAAVGVELVWEADPLSLLPRLTMLIVTTPDASVRRSFQRPWVQRQLGTKAWVDWPMFSRNGCGLLWAHWTDPSKLLPVSWHTNWVISSGAGVAPFTGIMMAVEIGMKLKVRDQRVGVHEHAGQVNSEHSD